MTNQVQPCSWFQTSSEGFRRQPRIRVTAIEKEVQRLDQTEVLKYFSYLRVFTQTTLYVQRLKGAAATGVRQTSLCLHFLADGYSAPDCKHCWQACIWHNIFSPKLVALVLAHHGFCAALLARCGFCAPVCPRCGFWIIYYFPLVSDLGMFIFFWGGVLTACSRFPLLKFSLPLWCVEAERADGRCLLAECLRVHSLWVTDITCRICICKVRKAVSRMDQSVLWPGLTANLLHVWLPRWIPGFSIYFLSMCHWP